ncbi:MAG: HAMP domain-containing histidine kinase [Zoogloea sp.]|nr:HAMP domain-containing histidine kinase [Zoogloea sp.]
MCRKAKRCSTAKCPTAASNTAGWGRAAETVAALNSDPLAAEYVEGFDPARWKPLRYFNLFRLTVAGLLAVVGRSLNLGDQAPQVFVVAALVYLAVVLLLGFPDSIRRLGFDRTVTVQVLLDIGLLTLLMWASGGYRSGLPILMLIILAGAGLVGEGRMVLFYAAAATLAVLLENAYRLLAGREGADFLFVGITCIGFFAVALLARLLARRALANEQLARERGADLANQFRLNQRIIRDMQDGVLVVGPDGRIRLSNPQALALLGAQAAEGLTLTECAPEVAEELARINARSEESRVVRAQASGRMLMVRFVPTGEAGDGLVYLEDFDRIQGQVQQIKLAALGRLTASMAHEIRNPLSAVTHAAELLGDEKRSEMRTRLLRIITDNARRIERLVRDVLALGRRDQAIPEKLPLAATVRELVDEFSLDGKEDGASVFDCAIPDGLTILLDRAHLRQILSNLLANARRYCSGAPGSVRISAVPREGGQVALFVGDDGPGIAAAVRNQVFEPFFTTHPKGTGLGLYIARELAEANGARLELLDDAPGTHFCLVAPGHS